MMPFPLPNRHSRLMMSERTFRALRRAGKMLDHFKRQWRGKARRQALKAAYALGWRIP